MSVPALLAKEETLFRLSLPELNDDQFLRLCAEDQREKFYPLCPDFVVELTSPSDRLTDVREKMPEWMANGCRLGWILHSRDREVYVYRPAGVEVLRGVTEVRGEDRGTSGLTPPGGSGYPNRSLN